MKLRVKHLAIATIGTAFGFVGLIIYFLYQQCKLIDGIWSVYYCDHYEQVGFAIDSISLFIAVLIFVGLVSFFYWLLGKSFNGNKR